MIATATILFDDSKNDLRALPKTVRLQLLTTLSFVWSTAFTLYFFGQLYADIWTGLVVGHLGYNYGRFTTHLNNFTILKKTNINGVTQLWQKREYVILRDKFGAPFKHYLPKNIFGGEHE